MSPQNLPTPSSTNLAKTPRCSVLLATVRTGHWATRPPCSHSLPHTVLACVLPAPCSLLLSHCWDARCTTSQPMWQLEGKENVSGEWPGGAVGGLQQYTGQGQGRAHTLNLLGPYAADGSSDQLAFLILTSASQLWMRSRPQVLDCGVQVFTCPAPSPALAWASPVQSALPHHSWTPAAQPAAPEQLAAPPPAAESCRDIITITPMPEASQGRCGLRVGATTGYPDEQVYAVPTHAGTCMPMYVSTNTTASDVLSMWVCPGLHDW